MPASGAWTTSAGEETWRVFLRKEGLSRELSGGRSSHTDIRAQCAPGQGLAWIWGVSKSIHERRSWGAETQVLGLDPKAESAANELLRTPRYG